jgi:Tol biopolymer transport system component
MRRAIAYILMMVCLGGCGTGLPARLAGPAGAEADAPSYGQVAFIRAGDLWVQAVPGGTPVRLTEGGGYDHPAWSASGAWLAVRRASGYIAVRADGSATHSLRGMMHVAWAPDRDELAYLDAEGRIGTVRPDGSGNRVLVTPGAAGPLGPPAWAPDGARLAFTVGPGERPTTPEAQVAVVPATAASGSAGGGPGTPGAAVTPVVSARQSPPVCFTLAGWSPDGRRVLYWEQNPCSPSLQATGSPLMAAAVGGEAGRPVQLAEQMLTYPAFLAGSQASGLLAVVDGAGRAAWTGKQVVLVDPATGRRTDVSPVGLAAVDPAWAPDGRQLAFAAGPETAPAVLGGEEARQALFARRIWVARAGDSGWLPAQLTQDSRYRDESPHFTRDGSRVFFARLDAQNRASLWLTRFDGVDSVAETDAPPNAPTDFYGHLDWAAVFAYRP